MQREEDLSGIFFLLGIPGAFSDKQDMIEKYWEQWALSPWHVWLKDEPQWLRLFLDVAVKIPQTAALQLLQPVRPLVFVPPLGRSLVVRLHGSLPAGANLLVLDPTLLKRPKAEAEAIIAHELAHLTFLASNNEVADDLKADFIASSWKFTEGLISALRKDLSPGHARLQALEESKNKDKNLF